MTLPFAAESSLFASEARCRQTSTASDWLAWASHCNIVVLLYLRAIFERHVDVVPDMDVVGSNPITRPNRFLTDFRCCPVPTTRLDTGLEATRVRVFGVVGDNGVPLARFSEDPHKPLIEPAAIRSAFSGGTLIIIRAAMASASSVSRSGGRGVVRQSW
jgi:hypothetical protein